MEFSFGMPKVTIIGAGSAVFARQIITDILAIDGLDEGQFARFRWVLLRCLKVIRLGWPAASVLPLLRGMRALTVIQCGARNTPRLKIFRQ